jgi:hypothetical protein
MLRKRLLLILCLLLAGCSASKTQTTSKPQAWFDMPLLDTVLQTADDCKVIAHGASSAGISAFELSINGAVIATVPNATPKSTLAKLEHACTPLQSGKNLIEVRAQDSAGAWSDSTQTTVFLAGNISITPTLLPRLTDTPVLRSTSLPTLTATLTASASPTGTMTPSRTILPTDTSTVTSTPAPIGGVTVERVSTNQVYLGRGNCGPLEVTITARATAPNGIRVVVLFYRFQTGNASSEFQSLSMKPIGGDLYEVALNPTSLLGGSVPFEQATLQYQIVIQQNDGDVSLRTPVLADIFVQACGGVTTTTTSCSAYTDERSCIANGCNWVSIPGTVPLYECRNP